MWLSLGGFQEEVPPAKSPSAHPLALSEGIPAQRCGAAIPQHLAQGCVVRAKIEDGFGCIDVAKYTKKIAGLQPSCTRTGHAIVSDGWWLNAKLITPHAARTKHGALKKNSGNCLYHV